MAGVTLENVTKRFGDVVAVKEATLEVPDQDFLVLVGPSGCGKTTTLRMVAGLEDITEGKIKIGEKVVNDLPPKDRDIAMVFQNYALYPHMNVFNNMGFGLKLRKIPRDEITKRVKEAAKLLGIENLLDRKPAQLSGGQRQRVALGRAIVRNPQVFLMDEPLSNLDAKLRVQMRAELSKLHDRLKTTIIYVTHDQTEAMTMGDKIVVQNEGVIQQVAPPLTLYNEPENMFVAGFIGSPAMNFIKVKLRREDEDFFVDGADLNLKLSSALLDKRPGIKEYANQDVIMGIRPEDLGDAQVEKEFQVSDDNSFTADVEVVEPLGSEISLYFKIGDISGIARVDADSKARVGDKIKLACNTEKIHLFDRETEEAIK